MRATAFALLLVLSTSVEAKAQDWWWQFSYNMGATAGETKDYIDQFSLRGIGFQGRKFMNFQNQWSLGFDLSWQVFSSEEAGTTTLDEEGLSAISGTAFNYINAFPLLVNAHYYLGSQRRGTSTGFVGVNTGMYYMERRTEAGPFAVTNDNWHFGIAPEVGVGVPAGRTFLTGTARFNWTAEAGGQDYQFWTFAIGIASR